MFNTRFVPLRTVALCACLLSPILLCGCGGGSSSTTATPVNTGPVTSAPVTSNTLQYTLSADKSVYKAGEIVNLTYAQTNSGAQPITEVIGIPNVIISVKQGDQLVWQTPQSLQIGGQGFGGGFVIQPNSFLNLQATWPQKITAGDKQAPAGQYTLTATLNGFDAGNGPTNPVQITIIP